MVTWPPSNGSNGVITRRQRAGAQRKLVREMVRLTVRVIRPRVWQPVCTSKRAAQKATCTVSVGLSKSMLCCILLENLQNTVIMWWQKAPQCVALTIWARSTKGPWKLGQGCLHSTMAPSNYTSRGIDASVRPRMADELTRSH